MPALVGDIWRFALEQRLFGQQVINTFALRIEAVPSGTSDESFVADWFQDATGYFNTDAALRDNIRETQTEEVTHMKWLVQRMTPSPTQVFDVPILTAVAGTHAGVCETGNVAACITRRGPNAGRRNKGRIAIAGLPSVVITGGEFGGAYITDLGHVGVSMTGLKTLVAGKQITMGWWNPAHTGVVGGVPVAYPALFVPAISYTARPTVRVQRSRTVGVGS